VLGILWLFGLASILALIFGIVGKHQIDKSEGWQRGRGIAVAGIVLGWFGVTTLTLFIVLAVIGSLHPTGLTTAPSRAAAARTYLGSIAPVNSAAATFASGAAQWNSQTTDSQAASEARPVISALEDLKQTLLNTTWPASARQDVKMLASDVTPVVADLQGLASLNIADAPSWEANFARDVSTLRTSDNAVRHDLGLPPLSSVGGTSAGTSNSTPAATNSPTPAGTSNPTSSGGNASHSSSRGTNTIGGSGNPSEGGSGNGAASCFGCVTISTVTWAFYPGPDIPSEYQNCVSASTTVASNTQVIGPQVADPTREFIYSAQYTNGCTASDGAEFTVGKVELQGADPPISIVSTNPAVPIVVTPGASQQLAVTLHALDGNYYNGPLVIDVIID
jgi:hypothetical protein